MEDKSSIISNLDWNPLDSCYWDTGLHIFSGSYVRGFCVPRPSQGLITFPSQYKKSTKHLEQGAKFLKDDSNLRAREYIGFFQLQHVVGFAWGIAQLFYALVLSEYDPLPADLNPDIVGRGVRFSVIGPSVGLIFTSILGYFHDFDSGAKELALVQLFS